MIVGSVRLGNILENEMRIASKSTLKFYLGLESQIIIRRAIGVPQSLHSARLSFYEIYKDMKLLTVPQLAETLSISPITARKWLLHGRLPGIKLPSGEWRVDETKLSEFLGLDDIQVSDKIDFKPEELIKRIV